MLKKIAMSIGAGLLGGSCGAAAGWLAGYLIYFFTEDLPYRNAPPGERIMHAVDGGLAVGILTFLILMPLGALIGSLAGVSLVVRSVNKIAEEQ